MAIYVGISNQVGKLSKTKKWSYEDFLVKTSEGGSTYQTFVPKDDPTPLQVKYIAK